MLVIHNSVSVEFLAGDSYVVKGRVVYGYEERPSLTLANPRPLFRVGVVPLGMRQPSRLLVGPPVLVEASEAYIRPRLRNVRLAQLLQSHLDSPMDLQALVYLRLRNLSALSTVPSG